MNKKVYICSPFRDENEEKVNTNIKNAERYGQKVFEEKNDVPIVPHLFTVLLFGKDTKAKEINEAVTSMNDSLLLWCDYCVVCGDHISEGMKLEINLCLKNNIPLIFELNDQITTN